METCLALFACSWATYRRDNTAQTFTRRTLRTPDRCRTSPIRQPSSALVVQVLVRDSDRVQGARSEKRPYPFLRVFAA